MAELILVSSYKPPELESPVSDYSAEIVKMVNDIIEKQFEVPAAKLVASADLKDDLGLDSLDFVDMIVVLEQQSGKTPQNIEFTKIRTLGDIYQIVTDLHAQEDSTSAPPTPQM